MNIVDVWKVEHQKFGSLNIYISMISDDIADEDHLIQSKPPEH